MRRRFHCFQPALRFTWAPAVVVMRIECRWIKGINVLLCDDHILVGDAVAQILAGEGDFHVTTCRSLPEALEAMGQVQFQIVLLDLLMPGMVGLSSIERVIAAAEGARVVLFSGNASADLIRKAVAAGRGRLHPQDPADPVAAGGAAAGPVGAGFHAGQRFRCGAHGDGAGRSPDPSLGAAYRHPAHGARGQDQQGDRLRDRKFRNRCEDASAQHFDKLQAKNRAHAVTIAAELGLI